MSKEELEKQIAKEIDFLSDHWVNGDDKPPFSFGGWRGEVIADLANLFEKSCKEREKAVAEDICVMIDVIESRSKTNTLEEWKQYKGIRNSIRDKYVLREELEKK